jgi:cysteine-rich repeat protein
MARSCAPILALMLGACGAMDRDADGTEAAQAISATCGNGTVDAGEQCDDGNAASHDGCSTTCKVEFVTRFLFTGAAGSETTFAASASDPGLAAVPAMSRGSGLAPSPATDAFSASAWTTSTALDPSDYFRFTVAPTDGLALNLRALQLDERRSGTGIRNWSVRSSLDGFATDLAVFNIPDDTSPRSETVQLPASFQSVTAAVEFRIFGFHAEAAGGTWRIDNVGLVGGLAATCGNAVVDPGEQCDDGNATELDGCDRRCRLTVPLYVKAFNSDSQDQFGAHVAISADGSTMAIGAAGESSGTGNPADNSVEFAGAVYVYKRTKDIWILQAYLKASSFGFDGFGGSVALSGDGSTLVVGDAGEDSAATGIDGDPFDKSAQNAGAVYVFSRNGETWTKQAYIKASNTGAGDFFGGPVAISTDGSTLAVGASFEASAATGVNGDQTDNTSNLSGAVYVFSRSGATWVQQAYVKASHYSALFGTSVALSSDGATLAVGASFDHTSTTGINGDEFDFSALFSGAAYVFTRSGAAWSQQAFIKASNTGTNDRFGSTLAISSDGSTLAVGAFGEASAATGTNGNQADDSAASAGAVYVFSRSAATWSQQAYLKASNTDAGDGFGGVLAMSSDGSTLAVGAVSEASAATGLNGDQTSNAAPAAGAAYLFGRSGAAWNQKLYIKASNTGAGDFFGSVALPADASFLAVGALGESSAATGIGGNQADNSKFAAGAVYVYR